MRNTLPQISLATSKHEEVIDISQDVEAIVQRSGVSSGMVWIFSPHTTAAITIQERADPAVRVDLLDHLRRLVPNRPDFHHSEGNSGAHIKTALIGSYQALPIEEGKLQLGTWQAIFFCEFDGPRNRHVRVKVIEG